MIVLRICTNDADGNAINGTIQGQIDTVLAKALGYADQVWIMALPPIGGTEAAYNANVPAYNAYFQGKVAADPSHLEVSGRHAGPLQRSQCEQRADGHQGHAPRWPPARG